MDEKTIRVAELFAGVGGFRLGLDGYHSEEHPEFEKVGGPVLPASVDSRFDGFFAQALRRKG